uniref:Mitochondrial fission 1 protein n=1 Tax=Lactuca sativa TaxID=4236 RepID=A0A9R1XXU0_LACSA|nr:hypothetical protein LSAT_V11C100036550 [Lactuca sativa]
MLKLSRFKLNVLIREILEVQCTSLVDTNNPLQTREKMYVLAVGYYRSGDYSKSRQLVDRCLEALNLKRTIEDHIRKDGVIGIRIAATTIGVVFGGIVVAMARR